MVFPRLEGASGALLTLVLLSVTVAGAAPPPRRPAASPPSQIEARMPDDDDAQPQSEPEAEPRPSEANREPDQENDPALQARFEALLRGQKGAAAAAALVDLARAHPKDSVAPEALFEAAQLYEEQLDELERARGLYQEVAERYPQSRLARRAEYRRDALQEGLRTGAAPLRELRAILATPAGPGPSAERLTALLARYPDFALADEAHYLLGSAYRELGREGAARGWLEALVRKYPSSAWAARGHLALGELALRRGDDDGARRHYQAAAQGGGATWAVAAAAGLAAVDKAARKRRIMTGAAALLGLFVLGGALRARRRLWPPPEELIFYGPVAAFLWVAGMLVAGSALGRPLLWLALGGAAIIWAGGASARAGAPRTAGLLLGGLLRVGAVAALAYLVVQRGNLTELVLEALRSGPSAPLG